MIAPAGAMAQAEAALRERVSDRLHLDHPLAPMTTYRVGGPAALFVAARTIADLVAVAEVRDRTGIPVLVIGRGSNMLVADAGFPGVVVSIAELAPRVDIPESAIDADAGSPIEVTAGGGATLPVTARRTAAAGVRGFEWAVGVPGSIGGAVRMNAGGHGSDMRACLIDVGVLDMDAPDAGVVRCGADALGLGFRSSAVPASHIVVDARLSLVAGDPDAAQREIAEVVHWRRVHQPGGQNCGSVFVNPVPGEVTSGGLIDSLGLRGFRIGTASVSDKHANFIQADEGATAADVRAVMDEVRRRVAEATGWQLRSEVRLVGFDDVDPMSFEELPT